MLTWCAHGYEAGGAAAASLRDKNVVHGNIAVVKLLPVKVTRGLAVAGKLFPRVLLLLRF